MPRRGGKAQREERGPRGAGWVVRSDPGREQGLRMGVWWGSTTLGNSPQWGREVAERQWDRAGQGSVGLGPGERLQAGGCGCRCECRCGSEYRGSSVVWPGTGSGPIGCLGHQR